MHVTPFIEGRYTDAELRDPALEGTDTGTGP
jgi:hypothetical protein